MEQRCLPDSKTFDDWLQHPSAKLSTLPQPSTKPLDTRALAKRAAAAYLKVGWVFQCNKCSHWHTSLAGGYAISRSAVATAYHVLQKPERMKTDTAFPIAVRGDHEVLVITGVIGADAAADTAIFTLKTDDLNPLALSTAAEVGDAAFCLSEPSGGSPYFSAGLVNRYARDPGAITPDPRAQRVNVSTDWAPGSSGSAVLDVCGNVIGHVGSITAISGPRKGGDASAHYMTLHWAIPAIHVLRLAGGTL